MPKKISDITLKMTFKMCVDDGVEPQWIGIDRYFNQKELDSFRNGAGDILGEAYKEMRKKVYWKHFMGEEGGDG